MRIQRSGCCGLRRPRSAVAKIGLLLAVTLVVGIVPTLGHAAPHGCVSVSNDYQLSADVARRYAGLEVYKNEPCSFFFSPGDTFSGSGEYRIWCATGGEFHDSLALGPQIQVPIPQPCDPGAVVTIYALQPWRGGTVVAGSPL